MYRVAKPIPKYAFRVTKSRDNTGIVDRIKQHARTNHLRINDFHDGSQKVDDEFTEREKDILTLMSEGLTAHEIAAYLFISPHTVKTHQKNMLKKTECSNSIQLVAEAIRSGAI